MFIHNVFHGRLDCPLLLSQFHLSAPVRRNRSPTLWHIPFARVATVKNGPFCRIVAKCNDLPSSSKDLDFFLLAVIGLQDRCALACGAFWRFFEFLAFFSPL